MGGAGEEEDTVGLLSIDKAAHDGPPLRSVVLCA